MRVPEFDREAARKKHVDPFFDAHEESCKHCGANNWFILIQQDTLSGICRECKTYSGIAEIN